MQNENRDKRSSMFTVRDAENAMIVFVIFALFVLVGVFLHEFVFKSNSFVDSLYTVADNISKILSAATLLTIFEEGFDIMFTRFRESRAKDKKLKAKALEAARAEGYAEGYAAAKAENGDKGNASPKSPKKPSK